MRPWFAVLFTAAIAVASPSFAASRGDCKSAGSTTAHALIALPQGDAAFNRAVAEATTPALLAKVRAEGRCVRAGGLTGENNDAYPRMIAQNNGLDVAFLVPVSSKGVPYFLLVKTWGSGAVRVDGLFDAIPDDARLSKAMLDFVDGGYEPLKVDDHGQLIDSADNIPLLLAATAKRMG